MAQLQYKTLAGESPERKPKVYFACHPEDHRGYFEEIADEILKHSNCAIYYYAPEDQVALDEDYFLNLGQMNLFVMPITTRLLYMPSRAMDVEFSYAVQHHIPVLPLMQEQDLDEQYKEKFGELQFLDKHKADATAIPYEEKLKKYLEAVLIGDELAAQVRAAFDACVFLSYRKKDRKYAQELMRLMHRDPACRDIAIWYDEFLTPGENFNNSIREAMERSGLFVLAVTPNLVNETNYIMTTEYPMAKDELHKPILPAEMVATDANSLRSCYPGIPESIDPAQQKPLTDAVLAALGELAKRENDDDRQHNFFIGLAYLTGIDVEVDHQRAVELITSAAEAGLTQAMEKLAAMYENGEGVQRDYREAIRWREKLAEQARLRYEETGSEDDAIEYFVQLDGLGDAWNEMENFSKAKQIFTFMASMAERDRQGESEQKRFEQSVSYIRLAENAMAEGDHRCAKSWVLKATESLEVLRRARTRGGHLLAWAYLTLAEITIAESNLDEAKMWCLKGVDWLEFLAQIGEVETGQSLGNGYHLLGRIAEAKGDANEARIWYFKGITVFKGLAETGSTRGNRILGVIYMDVGDIAYKEFNFNEARIWYVKSLEIIEPLAQMGTVIDQRNLATIYNKMGKICGLESNLTEAKEWLAKSLDIREVLLKTGTVQARYDLCASCNALGKVAQVYGNKDEARAWFLIGLEHAEILAKTGTVEGYDNLAVSYSLMGQLDDDSEFLLMAAQIYTLLLGKHPDVMSYQKKLIWLMSMLYTEEDA